MKRPGKTRQLSVFIMWRQEGSSQEQRNLLADEEVVCPSDCREIQRVIHKRGNLFPFSTALRHSVHVDRALLYYTVQWETFEGENFHEYHGLRATRESFFQKI